MMFFSSKTCRIALLLATACKAVTSAKEAEVALSEDRHPTLRGTAAATPVDESIANANAHSRMLLDAYTGSTANLAVHSGAGIIFTHPPTEILKGNVCSHFAFTGRPGLDYELTEYGTSVSSGGCDSSSLAGFLTDAMAKEAKPMLAEMGGRVITPGTYYAASINIADNTEVILQGGENDIFLFQSGAITTGLNTNFILQKSAAVGSDDTVPHAKNILFAVTEAATTGAGSSFPGSILAGAAVTLGAWSEVKGYVLATADLSVGEGCSVNSAEIGPSVIEAGNGTPSPITTLINSAKCFDDDTQSFLGC
jgi:hypothetical protein